MTTSNTNTMEMPSDWARLVRQCQNWDAESREKIVTELNSPEVKERLNEFCHMDFASSQEAANIFTDIINCALKSVVKRKSRGQTYKKPTDRRHPYCAEFQIAKHVFKKSKRQFNKDHNNIDRRQNYIREKKHLKKTCVSCKENFYYKESQRFSWLRKRWPETILGQHKENYFSG